jgi:deoxyribose-phosphate aldolase
MVVPIGLLRMGDLEAVLNDIQAVCAAAHAQGAILKVILENTYLDQLAKIAGCLVSQAAGADFVKTSTGFGPGGATLADVELMRRVVGPEMGVKAAGGIRTLADANAFLAAGATRLGCSSGVKIMQEIETKGS